MSILKKQYFTICLLFICINLYAGIGGIQINDPRLMKLSMGCVGYLLNETEILTAAHCLDYTIEAKELLGNRYEQLEMGYARFQDQDSYISAYKIINFTIPDEYVPFRLQNIEEAEVRNDIAIIKIEKIREDESVVLKHPLILHGHNREEQFFAKSFLKSNPQKQHSVGFKLKRIDENYGEIVFKFYRSFVELMFNSQTGFLCQGDSGSPLFQKEKDGTSVLVGVLSKGLHKSEKCESSLEVTYTMIKKYQDWIEQNSNGVVNH